MSEWSECFSFSVPVVDRVDRRKDRQIKQSDKTER